MIPRSSIQGTSGKWISGATYGSEAIVWSPVNYLTYIRLGAGGATSTDPSADAANWALFGPTKLRRTVKVSIVLSSTANSGTLSPAVNPAKSRIRLVGSQVSPGVALSDCVATVTMAGDGSSLTASRPTAGGSLTVQYEVDEDW